MEQEILIQDPMQFIGGNKVSIDNCKVYIFLVDSLSAFATLTKTVTHVPYGHASIAFNPDLEQMFSFSLTKNGFVQENIKNYNPDAKFSLYEVNVSLNQYGIMKKTIYDLANSGMKYNLKGALGSVFKHDFSSNKSLFCSEFVGYVFKSAGIDLLKNINLNKLKPYDITKSKKVKFLYRGKAKNYSIKKLKNVIK